LTTGELFRFFEQKIIFFWNRIILADKKMVAKSAKVVQPALLEQANFCSQQKTSLMSFCF
jgi:hypothetical protein